jgi:hypothetical protein
VPTTFTDDLKSLEDRVVARIRQLRPALREMDELREVAKRLGIDPDAIDDPAGASERRGGRRSNAGTPRRRARSDAATRSGDSSATAGRRPSRRTRASSGTRAQQVTTLVRERPGITVAELGAALDVDPTSLYRVVHQLEADGTVRKEGRALQPVG